jgi:hypothetical protein
MIPRRRTTRRSNSIAEDTGAQAKLRIEGERASVVFKRKPVSAMSEVPSPGRPSAALLAAGKALRDKSPRQDHGKWKRDKNVDVLDVLRVSDKGRVERLIPIRHGRMLESPSTFYRGSAAVMAADLATTPTTGIYVQTCGVCHLMKFGGFATPERNIDINDFDETLQAPWEWDLKRRVASGVLAARSLGLADSRRVRHCGCLCTLLSQASSGIFRDESTRCLVCAHDHRRFAGRNVSPRDWKRRS